MAGPGVELHPEHLLVTKGLRARSIAYRDITGVHGDVPARLSWSTHLLVEVRGARSVRLLPVDVDLATPHGEIAARIA